MFLHGLLFMCPCVYMSACVSKHMCIHTGYTLIRTKQGNANSGYTYSVMPTEWCTGPPE